MTKIHNDLIRGELGKIIDRDIDLPEGSLLTITRVITSPDLHYADVFFSVMPHTNEVESLEILAKRIGGIQHSLNRKLRMRPVPRIKFVLDIEQKRADRIEKLLAWENLKKGE
ncbi:MAG: Ribosome-binding factor A [Parcubacteria group bacterium GW2011_GWA1_51_12]|nr:MAG: Ribosome-binding factor A [Parcubacteria group bacterium GW2011_GWA1_51_12]